MKNRFPLTVNTLYPHYKDHNVKGVSVNIILYSWNCQKQVGMLVSRLSQRFS